jgi:hypothetical protein
MEPAKKKLKQEKALSYYKSTDPIKKTERLSQKRKKQKQKYLETKKNMSQQNIEALFIYVVCVIDCYTESQSIYWIAVSIVIKVFLLVQNHLMKKCIFVKRVTQKC